MWFKNINSYIFCIRLLQSSEISHYAVPKAQYHFERCFKHDVGQHGILREMFVSECVSLITILFNRCFILFSRRWRIWKIRTALKRHYNSDRMRDNRDDNNVDCAYYFSVKKKKRTNANTKRTFLISTKMTIWLQARKKCSIGKVDCV